MTARASRRALGVAAGLVLVIVALVGTAIDTQRDGSSAATDRAKRFGASIAWSETGRPAAAVAYAGPHRLIGPTTLRAHVRRTAQPVVAVTFLLDGRPLGSDTTAPYQLDVDGSLLPPGRHRLSVAAVDRVGRRSVTRPVAVRTGGIRSDMLTASPDSGFDPALSALARGHVTVLLAPGRYPVEHLELGSGARLVGAGADTVLDATAGSWSLITARGRGARVSDLVIDGGGLAERGMAVAGGSHDVRVQRVEIRGVTETGVEIWGTHSDVSIQDSVIAGMGAGGAGVFDLGSDTSRDTSVIRTDITGFRGYGINFVQRDYDRPDAARNAVALDNRISDIHDPGAATGTHEGAIWSGGVAAAIIGNRIRDTGWDGIQTVGSSQRVTVVDNEIARTRVGIYLEHETTDSLFARNVIADVATGINSEWRYGGSGSGSNTFAGNTIIRPAETGIFIDVAGDRNRIAGNVIGGGDGPAIVLQGASDNLVAGNRGCERPGERLVVEQSAHYDDGRAAHSLRNRLVGNESAETCPTP